MLGTLPRLPMLANVALVDIFGPHVWRPSQLLPRAAVISIKHIGLDWDSNLGWWDHGWSYFFPRGEGGVSTLVSYEYLLYFPLC